MNFKESNLLTNHPSQIDKHVLESFFRLLAGSLLGGNYGYILSK